MNPEAGWKDIAGAAFKGCVIGAAVAFAPWLVNEWVFGPTATTAAADAVTTADGAATRAAAVDEVAGPSVPYSRSHYGGSATNSPAGNAARAAGEGQPCPGCGNPQVSGTRTAPWPEHEPPLVEHYYEHGGHQMTPEQALAYARSDEAMNGTLCATCQRSLGGTLSASSKRMKELFGLG